MTTKSGVSTLNPYAESYIPLAKQDASRMSEEYKTVLEKVVAPDTCGTQKFPNSDDSKLKAQHIDDPPVIQPQDVNEIADKKFMDEEFEMDLAYLQMTFPSVSDQSLIDVYSANRGDLEAAVDMLSHLESYTLESADNLPDALDIGDAPSPALTGECSSVKARHVAGESSNSSDSADAAAPS
ncbi:hypothetical protein Ancab_002310 [Ancistrocladus abbreviatus]